MQRAPLQELNGPHANTEDQRIKQPAAAVSGQSSMDLQQASPPAAAAHNQAALTDAAPTNAEAQQPVGDATTTEGEQGAEMMEGEVGDGEQDGVDSEEDSEVDSDDEEEEESDWRQLLWGALHAAAPPSSFACSGPLQAPWLCPDISVSGVGRLGLPLSREQAHKLKAAAEQAPHGRGLQTVVDTAVRDAFQVDASQVTISSSWQPVLQSAVTAAARALDINDSAACSIEARLYKLLLYEQGGHFSAHQDTEKERGMIGTLVVQLPCAEGHTGGSLSVRHKGKHFTHHFAQDSASTLQYASFFADCEHELSTITSGMRLALVYNLVWVGTASAAPRLVDKSPAQVQLEHAVRAWKDDIAQGGEQERIAFLLEHQYTESNLRFEHLKGADRAMVHALSTCRALEAHLVLVTRKVSGAAEYSGWGCRYKRRRYYGGYSDDDDDDEGPHTMAEVYEDSTETGIWIARDGSSIDYGSIDPEDDFYDPEDKALFVESDDPDDEEYEGFTGNAGPTLDQIYYRTLLVLWPRSQALANASRAGFTAMLSVLNMRMKEASSMWRKEKMQQQQEEQQPGDAAVNQGRMSKAMQATHRDTSAVLKGCVEHLERQLSQPAGSGRFQWSTRQDHAQEVVSVMQQGMKAVRYGISTAAELTQALITATVNSPQCVFTGTALPAALAAAAEAVGAAAAGSALQQLMQKYMPTHPGSCIALIQALSAQQELQPQLATTAVAAAPTTLVDQLLLLAVAVPGLPAVQQQVVDKLVAAAKRGGPTAVGLASKIAALLPQQDQLPALLQQQLTNAAAAVLCAKQPLQHISSIVQLLSIRSAPSELKQKVVAAVAAEIRRSGPWQVSDMLQLLTKLQDATDLQKLLQAEVAASVFANSTTLASQTDDSMLQLSDMLLQTPELQSAHYKAFAAAAAERPSNFDLLAQLLQSQMLQAAPAEQACLSEQLCAALRRRTFIWQLSELMPLLNVMQGATQLNSAVKNVVKATLAECMFTNSLLLSSQSDNSMLLLSGVLLTHKLLKAAYFDVYATIVAQRPNTYNLLKHLLQSAPIKAAIAMPEVQQLVACQVANLERMSAVPAFSWHMPLATIPNYPQVESFLRGPNQSLTLGGFNGIAQARSAAQGLQGSGGRYNYNTYSANTSTYSLQALAAGTGKNARVNITKTRQWYDNLVNSKEPLKQELQGVKALQR